MSRQTAAPPPMKTSMFTVQKSSPSPGVSNYLAPIGVGRSFCGAHSPVVAHLNDKCNLYLLLTELQNIMQYTVLLRA